jgi:rapamycin-insensitive companion of mTOR
MAIGFISLCDQILAASSPHTPYDASKKPLSTLLNEMTYYVVKASKIENEDESIIYGLQLLLLSDVERVRAASLRALRYSIHRLTILDKFLESRLDYLVCRSLTIDLRNARERLEAYKFIRRLFSLYPQRIPHSFVYVLDAIVSSNQTTSMSRTTNSTTIIRSDQMVKCCLELLCEIALQNPYVLHECNAINTMLKFIVDFEQDELCESVLYALLHAVDRFTINDNSEPTIIDSIDPNGPAWILVDEGMRERHELIRNMFSQLVAIFSLCEKGSVKGGDRRGMTPAIVDNLYIKEPDKVKTLKSCAVALKTILHSWIGFTAFCQTRNSSIRLLVNCLLVQSEPMKMIILDLFYDLLNLDVPTVCDSYEATLKSMYQIWNLTTVEEGYTYVASEGAAKLPRLSLTRPNLLDSHMALMLLTFIDTGLIEAISELASSDNTILSIRATLLLANFIWLCNEHLPEEQSFILLPLLMDVAIADDDSVKRSFAREAMLNINAFFEFKLRTRHIHSFQLAQLIYHAQHLTDYYTLPQIMSNESSNRRTSIPTSDESVSIFPKEKKTKST